jgi:hypothetical protein
MTDPKKRRRLAEFSCNARLLPQPGGFESRRYTGARGVTREHHHAQLILDTARDDGDS